MNAARPSRSSIRRTVAGVVLALMLLATGVGESRAVNPDCSPVAAVPTSSFTGTFGDWRICGGNLVASGIHQDASFVNLTEGVWSHQVAVTSVGNVSVSAADLAGLKQVNETSVTLQVWFITNQEKRHPAGNVTFQRSLIGTGTAQGGAPAAAQADGFSAVVGHPGFIAGVFGMLVVGGALLAHRLGLVERLMHRKQDSEASGRWDEPKEVRRPDTGARLPMPAPEWNAPPPDRLVRLMTADGLLRQPLAADVGVRYQGKPLAYAGSGTYRLRNPPAVASAKDFEVAGEDYQLLDVDPTQAHVELLVAERTYPLTVLAQDGQRGRPLPDLPVVVEHGRGEPRSVRTDPAGKAEVRLPRGPATVRLASAGPLKARPAAVVVDARRKAQAVLTVTVDPPPLPDPAAVGLALPSLASDPPALAEAGRQALQAYVRAWREAHADPRLHLGQGPAMARLVPGEVASAIERMQEGLADLFREKQIQAHLAGRTIRPWQGRFAWRTSLPEHVLAAPSDGLAPKYLAEVQAARTRADAQLTQYATTLALRPGIRLLALADQLAAEAKDRRSLAHLAAADLVLVLTETFLTDPELAREWAKT
jgi:hypothetical protein